MSSFCISSIELCAGYLLVYQMQTSAVLLVIILCISSVAIRSMGV